MDNPSNIHGLENPSPSDSTHSGQVLPRFGFLEKREEGRAAQMWVWESPGQGGDTAASPETCQDLLLFPNPLFQSHLDRAGKAKAFTFPTFMENIIKQSHQHPLYEVPISPFPWENTRKIHPAAHCNKTLRSRHQILVF